MLKVVSGWVCLGLAVLSLLGQTAFAEKGDPLGWWSLDAPESLGEKAVNRGVEFDADGWGVFDGQGAHIEIPSEGPTSRLGAGDFSFAAWVETEEAMDDLIGDLISKYDPDSRKGFSIGFLDNAGVGIGHSNHRNLFFGVDDGQKQPVWVDRGRPGEAVFIMSLTVYEGQLYAGSFESGSERSGKVHRYAGDKGWIDCGFPDSANAVSALAVYRGELYAAASHYRAGGSSLEASENTTPGGRIYRYLGGVHWELCGELEGHEAIAGLVVYNDYLYASSLYAPAGMYRYEGGTRWVDCGNPNSRCVVLGTFNGDLLSGGYDADWGGVARYDGGKDWTYLGTPPGVTQTYSFAAYEGDLYVGTWPEGAVFRYGGDSEWIHAGRLGEELEVMGMMVYNGKLYAGTLPLAEVHRYEGEGKWTNTGQLDKTPDVKYRRAWTMAIHDGKLFCGTLPSGHVHSMETGQCISYDSEVPSGKRHVAAVYESGKLSLYIDGGLVAKSDSGAQGSIDFSNDRPLRIGHGPQDSFKGRMKDVRLYERTLAEEEIRELAAP